MDEGHDYQPDWDFDVLPVPTEADLPLANALAAVRTEILPRLGIADVTVFFADLDDDLGRYVAGTSSRPVIGIDHDNLRTACDAYGLDYQQQLAATLAHEIGHAYQETLGMEHLDEDTVEEFARRWVMEGAVDVDLLIPTKEPLKC